jgi:hypothetical protein
MTITVANRFRGPARSGNGGVTAGMLAARLIASQPGQERTNARPVQVRLQTPPPLATAMEVDLDLEAGTATLLDGEMTVATATWSTLEREIVPSVPYDEVAEVVGPFAGAVDHPFPGCFVCGPDRGVSDGLRLFPGAISAGRTACTWAPDSSVAGTDGAVPVEIVWAALDCPGGWSSDLAGRPMVLGTMTASVLRVPQIGERCVIVGRLDQTDERRSSTSTALYGDAGELLARAEAVWVRVDPAVFNRLAAPAS